MAMFRAPSRAIVRPAAWALRRRFLRQATTLLIGAVLSAAPATLVFPDTDTDLDKRTNKQWARLKRGLSPKTMAGCRKAAERLMPRMDTLLKGPQWESQTLAAIVSELKQAGVLPDRPPPRGPGCPQEAEELRGEAQSAGSSNSITAAIATAAAAVATVPTVGPLLAAILAAIAAVIIMIGQILANAKEQQAAQKEKKEEGKESEQSANRKKLQKRLVDEMEKRDDCGMFGKKAS